MTKRVVTFHSFAYAPTFYLVYTVLLNSRGIKQLHSGEKFSP